MASLSPALFMMVPQCKTWYASINHLSSKLYVPYTLSSLPFFVASRYLPCSLHPLCGLCYDALQWLRKDGDGHFGNFRGW